ncbi:MAG TPA: fibronectin type III-like domain-contianing protein, partial [Flavisolibacter sp.]|nr:fibronectin type III-like domain-contianing protein [Flavisolibacter sp.]
YFKGKVQYPFGFGLSYTKFDYRWLQKPAEIRSQKDTLQFSIAVKNAGAMDGDEVVQVYVQYPSLDRMPVKELKAFKRVGLVKGGEKEIQFSIPVNELRKWDLQEKKWKLYHGTYTIVVGSHSQDNRLSSSLNIKNTLN